MPGSPEQPEGGPALAIEGLDDLFAEALTAWERIEQDSKSPEGTAPPKEASEQPTPQQEGTSGPGDEAEDAGIVFEFDTTDFDAADLDDGPDLATKALEAEVETLAERVARLEAVVEKARAAHTTISGRLDNANRERRRQTLLNKAAEERIQRLEHHRQALMDERDEALQEVDRATIRLEALKQQEERQRARDRREWEDQRLSSLTQAFRELLPPLDHLELALEHSDSGTGRLADGVRMITQQFQQALVRVGLERIAPEPGTDFDPEVHEAILEDPESDQPAGSIARLHVCGYRFEGRLVRPARVVISKAALPPDEDDAPEPREDEVPGDLGEEQADEDPQQST